MLNDISFVNERNSLGWYKSREGGEAAKCWRAGLSRIRSGRRVETALWAPRYAKFF